MTGIPIWAPDLVGLIGLLLAAIPTARAAYVGTLLHRLNTSARTVPASETGLKELGEIVHAGISRRLGIWPPWITGCLIAGYGLMIGSRALGLAVAAH